MIILACSLRLGNARICANAPESLGYYVDLPHFVRFNEELGKNIGRF